MIISWKLTFKIKLVYLGKVSPLTQNFFFFYDFNYLTGRGHAKYTEQQAEGGESRLPNKQRD